MIEKCTLVEPFFCSEKDKITEVAKKLNEYKQRHIYVVDNNKKPVGIISLTDIMTKVVAGGMNCATVTAKDIMTTTIYPFDDKDLVKNAYKVMTDKKIISVPVTEKGKYIGTLTIKEAIRFVTDPKNIE